MLSPNHRILYADMLTPPPGLAFDAGLATSYTVDLTTLLGVPLHLAMAASEDTEALLRDPAATYEALERVARRLVVFCHPGGLRAPARDHLLYALLEPVVAEVALPEDGVFHPKMWLLRFTDPEDARPPLCRLLITSRNLTADRSWDAALVTEGEVGRRALADNQPLHDFLVETVASAGGLAPDAARRMGALAEDARRVVWDLPEGFERLRFHALGPGRRRWSPPESRELLVVSPFVTDGALRHLADSTRDALALVSRSDELDGIAPETLARFGAVRILHDAAETEDGDEPEAGGELGLHAKVYLWREGAETHLALGSANATGAALAGGGNVELLAELTGPARGVGSPRDLLDMEQRESLGTYLIPYRRGQPDPEAEARRDLERRLELARRHIVGAELRLRCARAGDGTWRLVLEAGAPLALEGIDGIVLWPVTLRPAARVDGADLAAGGEAVMNVQALSRVTGLIAFELRAESQTLAFVVNLPVADLPPERDQALLQAVIRNRAGFLRYLLLLLAGMEEAGAARLLDALDAGSPADAARGAAGELPLLEHLVRAYIRDPRRLERVRTAVERLADAGEGDDGELVLPPEFLSLWEAFDAALKERAHG